jgi:hypothetical protein
MAGGGGGRGPIRMVGTLLLLALVSLLALAAAFVVLLRRPGRPPEAGESDWMESLEPGEWERRESWRASLSEFEHDEDEEDDR